MLDDTDQLQIAKIASTFLIFGADLLEDLREWVAEEFKRCRSDPVKKVAKALLQLIEYQQQKTGSSPVSNLNAQTTAIKDDHNKNGMPLGPPISLVSMGDHVCRERGKKLLACLPAETPNGSVQTGESTAENSVA
jgi:hypothetical protein